MMNQARDSGPSDSVRWFSLQWHITALCDQQCAHCYIVQYPEIWQRELKNELTLFQCQSVIDDLVVFCDLLEAKPFIILTGGDPLLRDDIFEICAYAQHRNIGLKMMGNPFHCTADTITSMRQYGIRSFQLSIDGLEATHDALRQPGSFKATLEAIGLLREHGMRTVVMYTVSDRNIQDVLEVMRLVSDFGVDVFAFARYCESIDPCVSRVVLGISPQRYRKLLIESDQLAQELHVAGSRTLFNKKDHLWQLLAYERGDLAIPENPGRQIIEGCSIGRSCLAILADGTVYACRRFPSSIGQVPQQSLVDIFTSDALEGYRQVEHMEKCGHCPLLYYCRGCPAVAFAHSGGNFFSPDPQCWKE